MDRRIDVENRQLRHVLTQGFTAGGRHWKFATPVHDEHRPESQRTLFVSVSGRGIDPKDGILDVKQVRDWHIPPKENKDMFLSDYVKRFKLSCSQTIGAVEIPSHKVLRMTDGISKRSKSVMTDGCGWVKEDVMDKITESMGYSNPPSAIQGRIGSAKGVWLRWTDSWNKGQPALEKVDWDVCIRDSQSKFNLNNPDKIQSTLEVCDYSRLPPPSHVNKDFIRFLHARGVPVQVFEGLQDEELDRFRQILQDAEEDESTSANSRKNPRSKSNLQWLIGEAHQLTERRVKQRELRRERSEKNRRRNIDQEVRSSSQEVGSNSETQRRKTLADRDWTEALMEMLKAGFEIHHPLMVGPIKRLAKLLMRGKLCLHSSGAAKSRIPMKMRLQVDDSRMMLVVPDPTGTLKSGECCFRVGVQQQMTGKCVLARHPIYYKTCIRVSKMVKVH